LQFHISPLLALDTYYLPPSQGSGQKNRTTVIIFIMAIAWFSPRIDLHLRQRGCTDTALVIAIRTAIIVAGTSMPCFAHGCIYIHIDPLKTERKCVYWRMIIKPFPLCPCAHSHVCRLIVF
jgi:hypothetical protein